jgi:hypothetical protein
MWLELTQPVYAVAEDGGDQYRLVRGTLSEMKIPPSRRVRVSVPLDRLATGDSSTSVEEEKLGNGCVFTRRGRVHQATHRIHRYEGVNELGIG